MIGLSSGLEGCVGVVIRVQLVCNRKMSAMTKGWPWSASCAIVNNKLHLFSKLYIHWGNGT